MKTKPYEARIRLPLTIGHGRPLLLVLAVGLLLAGLLALILAATRRFLPHDEAFLGMTATDLCAVHGCRIVHFMVHDRVSFGAALVAIGLLYLWLVECPLRQGQAWAWWLLLVSGLLGFGSFFAYLGYGYLDSWHGIATLVLLPCFGIGLRQSWAGLGRPRGLASLLRPGVAVSWFSRAGLGRACLLGTSAGMVVGGLTILAVGMTCVFVPQDLAYLGLPIEELHALNPRLVPLIAHDRAGFGGAVCCCGLTLCFCVWCGSPTVSLWKVLGLAGVVGFIAAIGIHPLIGYNDSVHLAPAVLGASTYLVGLLAYRPTPRAGREPMTDDRAERLTLPPLRELGLDLLQLRRGQRLRTLALPFVCCGSYLGFALLGWWPPAIVALGILNFVTYGSTSHDLVHRNLGLPQRVNDWLLCLTELLALRSGHAYQAAHLHHHAHYPQRDDREGAAAHMSWPRALAEGLVFPYRIWWWAVCHSERGKGWLYGEAVACVVLAAAALLLIPWTPVFAIYASLIVAGAWLNPLLTAYLPHTPNGTGPLTQTRLFRGRLLSWLAWDHLYHLEHHLYPCVPHHNWPRLAHRLDPYLKRARVPACTLWF